MYSKSHCLIAFLISVALAFAGCGGNAQTAPAPDAADSANLRPQTAPAPAQTTPAPASHRLLRRRQRQLPRLRHLRTSAPAMSTPAPSAVHQRACCTATFSTRPARSFPERRSRCPPRRAQPWERERRLQPAPIRCAACRQEATSCKPRTRVCPVCLRSHSTDRGADRRMSTSRWPSRHADVQVVVTDESGPTVSTDADANASAIVLKGSDLDALSDDPDEFSNELDGTGRPFGGPQWRADLHRRIHRRHTAAQVGHPRDSHQSESFFRRVRPHRLWAHRDSHQAGNRYAAWPRLRARQRQRRSTPATRSPQSSGLPQLPVQRHRQRRDFEEGLVLHERGRPRTTNRQCVLDRQWAGIQRVREYLVDQPRIGIGQSLQSCQSS